MKKSYEKPIVEVMDARVEKGFAGSGNTPDQEPEHGTYAYNEGSTTFQFN